MKELCKTKNSLLRVSQRAGSLQRPVQGWHSVPGEMLIGFLECTSRIMSRIMRCPLQRMSVKGGSTVQLLLQHFKWRNHI